jgi:predicted ATPase/class 3 adenylate cyclase
MAELPTGTVTFLFTDIEGSTRLWEQHSEAMRDAMARHDVLAAAVIEQHAGTLVKSRGEGDSLFAVFHSPAEALAAARALQQALLAEPWPAPVPLRVRMALHTGEADRRDGDYYGAAVNRCARLRAAGHGGQILLSLATQELVRDHLPQGGQLIDLGEWRLKDLIRPERIFQFDTPGLPSDFPPLRSLEAFPHNLPIQLTSFVAREREMVEIKSLLSTTRLLTLTGAGGCGKTRLSLQVAADLLDTYPDGVWLVKLAPLADPDLVAQTVAAALGVREEPGRPIAQTLVDFLKPRALLLVLDNCEHLIDACAGLAESLLHACLHVRILASSREALGIAGETPYRVPSLSAPDARDSLTLERLAGYEAARLFIDRAVAALPTFTPTSDNTPALAEICRRLDGIPLAIELAAARVKALPVEQIALRLDDRFRLLTGGSRTALPRHQTLRALIDWSYNLLSEPERTLLRRLSVFAGGCTLEAAEAVCSGNGVEEWEILDLLAALVDKSLVQYEEPGTDAQHRSGEARYRLLETLRQYGRDRLLETGEVEAVRACHRDWAVQLAERAEPELWTADQSAWLVRLETEHDNLRAALEWSLAEVGTAEEGSHPAVGRPGAISGSRLEGLRLAAALWRFWFLHGHFSEGRRWLGRALAASEGRTVPARAWALVGSGRLAHHQGDYERAKAFLEEALAQYRGTGEQEGIAWSLGYLGLVAHDQGQCEQAAALLEEGLALFQQVNHPWGIAWVHSRLGVVAHEQGQYERATSLLQEGVSRFRRIGDKLAIGRTVGFLGNLLRDRGQYDEAEKLLDESLALARSTGDRWAIAWALHYLGLMASDRGDSHRARELLQQACSLFRELGEQRGLAHSLSSLGKVAHTQANSERAARLMGAAEALRDTIGLSLPPSARAAHESVVAAVRARLGQEGFAAAWAAGRAMTPGQAVGYELEAGDV